MNVDNAPLCFVIEDDSSISSLFQHAMEAASYRVAVIRNGLDAIARLKQLVPEMVLLDLHIPGINGVEILHYLRGDGRFDRSHVIVTTADVRKAEEVRGLADFVFVKPIEVGQLRDIAARLHPGMA